MSNFYSNHYLSVPIYKHKLLPIVETGEFDFFRCVPFQDSFYGKTVSELHAGNLRMSQGRYSNLFPGEKISYWASDRETARAEVKKHGANSNLLTFFAYDDATASFPTLSKERELLVIIDGIHFGFLEILLKIENGKELTKGEKSLVQQIKQESPDCLAYESEIDRTKTNYIFFEKGFKKLAVRELRLRLGSEQKISKNIIWCAGTCDYTAYLESYGEFFLPKARLGRDSNYTNSEEYKSRKAINNYWYGVYNDSIKRKPHIEISVNPKTGEVCMRDKPGTNAHVR